MSFGWMDALSAAAGIAAGVATGGNPVAGAAAAGAIQGGKTAIEGGTPLQVLENTGIGAATSGIGSAAGAAGSAVGADIGGQVGSQIGAKVAPMAINAGIGAMRGATPGQIAQGAGTQAISQGIQYLREGGYLTGRKKMGDGGGGGGAISQAGLTGNDTPYTIAAQAAAAQAPVAAPVTPAAVSAAPTGLPPTSPMVANWHPYLPQGASSAPAGGSMNLVPPSGLSGAPFGNRSAPFQSGYRAGFDDGGGVYATPGFSPSPSDPGAMGIGVNIGSEQYGPFSATDPTNPASAQATPSWWQSNKSWAGPLAVGGGLAALGGLSSALTKSTKPLTEAQKLAQAQALYPTKSMKAGYGMATPPAGYQPGFSPSFNYFPTLPYREGGRVGYAKGGDVTMDSSGLNHPDPGERQIAGQRLMNEAEMGLKNQHPGGPEAGADAIGRFRAHFGDDALAGLMESARRGDGMSDSLPATIDAGPKKGKREAALAAGEYVVPGDVMAHIGNGSTGAGAREMDKMKDRVRMAKTGTTKQPDAIKPDTYLPA